MNTIKSLNHDERDYVEVKAKIKFILSSENLNDIDFIKIDIEGSN